MWVWMGQVWPQADELGEGSEYTGNHCTISVYISACLKFSILLKKKILAHAKKINLCQQPKIKPE